MELVTATSSISGKIESIIKEAEEDLYLVSPYIQLEKSESDQWENIKKALNYAIKQGVDIYIIARQDKKKAFPLFEKLKETYGKQCKILLVSNLHAKLYYNGEDALITSMNMYFQSSKKNYEIGVQLNRKRNLDDMKKLKKYINYLIEEAIEYKSTHEQAQDEELHANHEALKETLGQIDREIIQFEVSAIGYKWFKVKTPEGYENKILIKDAPNLEEGNHYIVKAKKKWSKTQYGYSVQLEQVHDIEEIHAFCISCRKPTDGKYDLCYSCNSKFKINPKSLEFHYCKSCGKSKQTISIQRPNCNTCYKSSKQEKRKEIPHGKLPTQMGSGFCIQCVKSIPYDSFLKKVRCRECWGKDKKALNQGEYCHQCGQAHPSSVEKPLCYTCFKKNN